jgi:uncharacterized linocin/CFP29 family protein
MRAASTQQVSQVDAAGAAEPVLAGNAVRKEYRSNTSRLPEGSWREVSDLLVRVAQERLNVVQDLQDNGLVNTVGMGTTVSTWQETNEFDNAETTMDGRSDVNEEASTWTTKGVPVPIHHMNFRIGHREEAAEPDIQQNNVTKAMRQVMERMEDIVINGWGHAITDDRGDTFDIYGYTNHPDRNQYTGSDWSTTSNVDSDIQAMIDQAENADYYGPYQLYVSGEQWSDLRAPSPDFDNSRLRETIEDLSEIDDVTAVDKLDDGEAVLVQLTSDVVDAVAAGDLVQTAEWNNTPFETIVKTFSMFAPRVKSDGGTNSGLVHATGLS